MWNNLQQKNMLAEYTLLLNYTIKKISLQAIAFLLHKDQHLSDENKT